MIYVAFLRAVNVGKHNRLCMKEVCALLTSLGLEKVSYHLQSGNLIFQDDRLPEAVTALIEGALPQLGAQNVSVMLRSLAQIQHLTALQPFAQAPADDHHMVVFLNRPADLERPAPGGLSLLQAVTPLDLITSFPKNPGKGIPNLNGWLEKQPGLRATGRWWHVILEIEQRMISTAE